VKILLIGKNGQIGWELSKLLPSLGSVTALGREDLDLNDLARTRTTVRLLEPDLIVNAAAYTAVDRAEQEHALARAINAIAPAMLADEAARLGAGFVHYSTDYIFDGEKGEPYLEDDEPNPLSVYGDTKLEGERAIQETGASALILRTSWVYGLHRENFVTKVFQWAAEKPELKIVADQVSRPTWSLRIAGATVEILRRCIEAGGFPENCSGIFHLASSGAVSRYGWAKAILHHAAQSAPPRVVPVESSEFPTAAVRPRYTALDCTKLDERFGIRLPDWQYDLSLALTAQNLPEAERAALAAVA